MRIQRKSIVVKMTLSAESLMIILMRLNTINTSTRKHIYIKVDSARKIAAFKKNFDTKLTK